MNGVLCALDLLAGCDDADRELFVNTALNSARDLNRVVGAILHLASLEAGTADIEPVAFDLHDLVEREAAVIAPAAAAKNLSVECRIDPAVPRGLTGSPDNIRQILRTLLENAVKFTPAGSVEVSLTACPRYSPGSSTCSCPDMRHSGAMACFSLAVRDTGIGIAPEFQSSLFEAFTQCDLSLNRLHEGCGLGLAICNRLSQRLGVPSRSTASWTRAASSGWTCRFPWRRPPLPGARRSLPPSRSASCWPIPAKPAEW